VAAAFPHLPEAKASGFLVELRPGLGRNHVTLQVLDQDRVWRTFYTATLWAFPLTVLKRLGFSNLHRFLISYLQQSYSARKRMVSQQPAMGHARPWGRRH
jgi:hypothetical protein